MGVITRAYVHIISFFKSVVVENCLQELKVLTLSSLSAVAGLLLYSYRFGLWMNILIYFSDFWSYSKSNQALRFWWEVMDIGTIVSEPRRSGSFSCRSSATSSLRRRSISLSAAAPVHIDDDIESEIVSEAGDIGDRALHSNRHSESSSHRFSVDHALENGVSTPTFGDTLLHPNGYWSRDPPTMSTISVVTPLPEEIISPLSTDAIVCSKDKMQVSFHQQFLISLSLLNEILEHFW